MPYYEQWATGMTHDGTHLWVVDARGDEVHQIDPVDGTTIASFPAPAEEPTGIAFDGAYLWVADHGTDQIYMLDRRQGRVITSLVAPGPYPSALVAAGDSLWVADYQLRKLHRIGLPDETPYVEDQERRVRVTFAVTYRVDGAGSVEELTARLALPRDIPGQHLLGELTIEPAPARIDEDRWGQRVAILPLGSLAAGESRTVRWTGDFALFRTRFQIRPERVAAAELPDDLGPYLRDDKKYDLSAKVITDLVTELTAEAEDSYDRARAIYDHLTEVITYDRSSGWNNAATVLKRGTGSCSEYTFALVALLRRAGIPARYVGAVSERGDEASFDDVFHRWAEAYLPGYGWVPIDANAGHGEPPGERGFFFGGRSNRHVVTTIGGGASELLDWDYNSYETYQVRGQAKLATKTIARYRPLPREGDVEPHEARRVLAPRLDDPAAPPDRLGGSSAALLGGPWLAAVSLLVGLGLGFVLSRRRRVG